MKTESQIQLFNFNETEFSVIKDKNDNLWFVGNEVCNILGYANPRDAIAKNCKTKGVAKSDTLTKGGKQEVTIINEGNLYRLVLKSNKPEAEPFEEFVCDVVLPTLRKTGKVEMNQSYTGNEVFKLEHAKIGIHQIGRVFINSGYRYDLGDIQKAAETGHKSSLQREYRDKSLEIKIFDGGHTHNFLKPEEVIELLTRAKKHGARILKDRFLEFFQQTPALPAPNTKTFTEGQIIELLENVCCIENNDLRIKILKQLKGE